MERNLISWNVPNLITVPLMAFAAFLVVGAVWQGIKRATGLGGTADDGGSPAPAQY